MERASALLHVFYNTGPIPNDHRHRAHDELVSLLRNPHTADDAARYIASATAASAGATNISLDAVVLFYACSSLEERIRSTEFVALHENIQGVRATISLVIDFIVAMYRRNSVLPSSIPQHVIVKAARTAVTFGRREWAISGNNHAVFPRTVLQLIGQEGSLPHMFAGTLLLTVLVDDALDPRSGMLTKELNALTANIRMVIQDVLSALEIGLRIKGPGLPDSVPIAAARSITNVVKIHPIIASDAAKLLRRCVSQHADKVSAEMMGVLADLYSESNVRLNQQDCSDALLHASSLLEAVAMDEGAKGLDEHSSLFRIRLMTYAEAVSRRVIGLGVPISALERLFNGLMGTCLRWTEQFPDSFSYALDAWISIFEVIEDCEADTSGNLMDSVLKALSQLCVQRCFFATNSQVLQNLPDNEDEADEDDIEAVLISRKAASDPAVTENTLKSILGWDQTKGLVEILCTSTSIVNKAQIEVAIRGEQTDGNGEADFDTFGPVSRAQYVAKCVETLVTTAHFSVETVGLAAIELAVGTLKQQSIAAGDEKYVQDVITSANIAYSLTRLLPPDSPPTRAVVDAVITQLQSVVGGKAPSRALFSLLRIAASLTRVLEMKPNEPVDEFRKTRAEALSNIAIGFLGRDCAPVVSSIASILFLGLVQSCGDVLFAAGLPYSSGFSEHNRHIRPVPALMSSCIVECTLVKHGHRNVKWSDEEKKNRTEKFSKACHLIFGDFVRASQELKAGITGPRLADISRGATLLQIVIGRLLEQPPQSKEIAWEGGCREISKSCIEALVSLKQQLGGKSVASNEGVRKCVLSTMGCLVSGIRSVFNICQRQIRREAPSLGKDCITVCLDVAQGNESSLLARVLLKFLNDHVNAVGFNPNKEEVMSIVEASVQVATRSLNESEDSDLGQTAVMVLKELINRQWLALWPEDAVKNGNTRQHLATNGESLKHAHDVYFRALQAVVGALRRKDLTVSRAALLALETLNASRKLYARDASFRGCGAAESAIVGALEILGANGDDTRKSLVDEAHSVVWGIAKVNFDVFYKDVLPKVIRALGECSDEDLRRLCSLLAGVNDRPSFVKSLTDMTNDLRLVFAQRKAPVL